MGLLSFIRPSSVNMSEVPSTPRSDLLREHRKTLSPPPAPTPTHCYGQKFLSQRLLSFSFFPVGSLTLHTPLQRGKSISHHNVCDSYQNTFFKDTAKGAGLCWERPLEWRTEVTRTKVLGVTIWFTAMCPAWQAKRCVLHRRTMKILASPVIPTADSGRPLAPSAYPAKALDIPMFMSTERLLEGQAPVRQGVSSLLFVYLVSVVTEGLALSSWVSGATRCWGSSCSCT